MKINQLKKVQVEAKTLHLHLKVTDRFCCSITDQDGQELVNKTDIYVPGFMPGEHHGDYVLLDIDLDTGQIKNWKKLDPTVIEEFIGSPE